MDSGEPIASVPPAGGSAEMPPGPAVVAEGAPPSPSVPAEPVAADSKREAAVAALEALDLLIERVAIYPYGHPAVASARDRAHARITETLETRGPLGAVTAPGGLLLDGGLLDTPRSRSLALVLSEVDIASIQLDPGVEAGEVLELAGRSSRARSAGGPTAARRELGSAEGSSRARVALVDYAAIRFDKGPGDESERPAAEDPVWVALSQSILGAENRESQTPERLAESLAPDILREGPQRAGELSRQLHRLFEDADRLSGDSRREAQGRMGRFLTALPPALREELLRIGAAMDSQGADGEGHLAPESLATALLFGAVQHGQRPQEDAVALLSQLLRTSSIDPKDRARLDDLLAQASGGTGSEELDRLGETVREIFRRREDVRANPADYQALIDLLARSGARPEEREAGAPDERNEWKARFGDAADAKETLGRAVEIAAWQFGAPGANDHAAQVLAFVDRAWDEIVGARRIDELDRAVRAAEEFGAAQDTPEPSRQVAKSFLDSARTDDRIRKILAAGAASGEATPGVVAFVRRAGEAAVEPVFSLLEGNAAPALADPLRDVLLEQPPARLIAAARARATRGWRGLRPAFPVLAKLHGEGVVDFLVELLAHEDENVRSHALSALGDEAQSAGFLEEVLGPLLRDPSLEIMREALRRLGALPGPGSVELLSRFVSGRVKTERAVPSLERRLFAVRVLTLKGAPGWEALGGCLIRLGWSLRKDDVELGRAIARAVLRRHEREQANKLLFPWRFSPGGVYAAFRRREDPRVSQIPW